MNESDVLILLQVMFLLFICYSVNIFNMNLKFQVLSRFSGSWCYHITAWHYKPEDHDFNLCHCEDLKSCFHYSFNI